MSVRYADSVRWSCDKCPTTVIGWSDVLPDGWSAAVVDAKLEHYCAACGNEKAGVIPKRVLPS